MTPEQIGEVLSALVPLIVAMSILGPLAALFAYDAIGALFDFILTFGKPGPERQSSNKSPVICAHCGAFYESTEPCNPSSKS